MRRAGRAPCQTQRPGLEKWRGGGRGVGEARSADRLSRPTRARQIRTTVQLHVAKQRGVHMHLDRNTVGLRSSRVGDAQPVQQPRQGGWSRVDRHCIVVTQGQGCTVRGWEVLGVGGVGEVQPRVSGSRTLGCGSWNQVRTPCRVQHVAGPREQDSNAHQLSLPLSHCPRRISSQAPLRRGEG